MATAAIWICYKIAYSTQALNTSWYQVNAVKIW